MEMSIIIVNYNTLDITQRCIDSIFKNTHNLLYEVILVDNASKDGSIEYFSADTRIKFIESGANIGFGKANNLGYKYSTGDVILFLNSDTVIFNNVLCNMYKRIKQSYESTGLFGALLYDKDKNITKSYGAFPKWYKEFFPLKNKCICETNVSESKDVDFVSGADLFVKRDCIVKMGLFDPDFFMYYEDTEMAFRYKMGGYNSVILNETGIFHLEGGSPTNSYRRTLTMTQSYFTYLKKTNSPFKWKVIKTLIVMRRLITVWKYNWELREKKEYINRMIHYK